MPSTSLDGPPCGILGSRLQSLAAQAAGLFFRDTNQKEMGVAGTPVMTMKAAAATAITATGPA